MVRDKTKLVQGNAIWYMVAISRLLLGFTFLWAFLDKLYGLNHATSKTQAWLHGGSPTRSFLVATQGPFAGFFHVLAGHAWVDWLFMIGLAAIGVALITGIAVRIAVVTGSLLLALIWAASLPIHSSPIAIDEHVLYIVMLWVIFLGYPHQVWSLGAWWRAGFARWRWLW
jgi:thiosulfate dehydrogenase [quinone] large subunit